MPLCQVYSQKCWWYDVMPTWSFEKKSIDVLVENKLRNQDKLFGRNSYLSSVIFKGSKENIGKIVKVKIESYNQNSLFGKIENNNMKAA